LAETETSREEPGVRDIETIDAELRILVPAWRVAREMTGCTPSTTLIDTLIDQLLDERVGTIPP
jgi:hypothetical protein